MLTASYAKDINEKAGKQAANLVVKCHFQQHLFLPQNTLTESVTEVTFS